ncbi:MAG: FkbM family methyltransferase [Hyphomicrobium sp.]|nr:FkbM family methyltransferase [Hyphomicrobium sp.]
MLDVTEAYGLSFWFPARDDGVGSSLRSAGEFAKPEVDLLTRLHEPHASDAYVDIGANIGAIALPIAARFRKTPIFAYEAHPGLHTVLSANIVGNKLWNVRALHCAVGDRDGEVSFPAPPLAGAQNFGATGFGMASDVTATVLMRRLDTLLGSQKVATIKIDVEGFEAQVLNGAEETISRDKPAILFEAKKGPATVENARWFLTRGYALYWFFAPFVTPKNEKGAATEANLRGDINLLALPEGRDPPAPLPRLSDPAEDWQSRTREMTYLAEYGIGGRG